MEVDASKGGIQGGLRSALCHDMVLPAEHLGNGPKAPRKDRSRRHHREAEHFSRAVANQSLPIGGWGVKQALEKD